MKQRGIDAAGGSGARRGIARVGAFGALLCVGAQGGTHSFRPAVAEGPQPSRLAAADGTHAFRPAVKGGPQPSRPVAADAGAHPFRLSVADAGMTGGVLHARVRFFWDDLQLAVAQHTSDEDFELAETEEVDATIERYINEWLVLTSGDDVLPGRVTARGIDHASVIDEVMWWYRMEYVVEESVERVHIRNRLLFNVFDDQRNIVHLKTRRGRERAYYFNLGDDNVTMRLN